MAFMLPALGGLLGSMLFKADGGKIMLPEKSSSKLMSYGGKKTQFPNNQFGTMPVMPMLKKRGGKIKKKHKK